MKKSQYIDNNLLQELGVLDWGYTEDSLPKTFNYLKKWVEDGHHGPLKYLADHRMNIRSDLRLVYPDFQSALVFLFTYQESKKWMLDQNFHEVAGYTLGFGGEDYHKALKNRLSRIAGSIKLDDLKVFYSLDAQPVLERDLAFRAGLGWFGKNSMLIHKKEGSYFIIGSILLNKKLSIDPSVLDSDHCGHCTACADACPTQAINLETRTLIATKCISTYTIETFKESPPPSGFDKSRGEIFGCDICQDVCPWNKKILPNFLGKLTLDMKFTFLKQLLFDWPKKKLQEYIFNQTNRGLKKIFADTAFDRPGREGWLKNLNAISSQSDLLKKNKDGR